VATNVASSFPNGPGVARLVAAVAVEYHEEWAMAEHHYLSEESMAKIGITQPPPVATQTVGVPCSGVTRRWPA